MNAEPWFIDTNVLVYLFDDDSPHKQKTARQLLDAPSRSEAWERISCEPRFGEAHRRRCPTGTP